METRAAGWPGEKNVLQDRQPRAKLLYPRRRPRHRMPTQDIPATRAGATAPLRRHAPILSRARAHAWVHGYRGAGPALRAHSWRLQVRHGQSIVQISLRFDRRTMDANQSVAIYIPRQVTNGQERRARDAR